MKDEIKIDPDTGLAEVPEDHFWHIDHHSVYLVKEVGETPWVPKEDGYYADYYTSRNTPRRASPWPHGALVGGAVYGTKPDVKMEEEARKFLGIFPYTHVSTYYRLLDAKMVLRSEQIPANVDKSWIIGATKRIAKSYRDEKELLDMRGDYPPKKVSAE